MSTHRQKIGAKLLGYPPIFAIDERTILLYNVFSEVCVCAKNTKNKLPATTPLAFAEDADTSTKYVKNLFGNKIAKQSKENYV